MFVPIRTFLLWCLGAAVLLAGWQGVYASTSFDGGGDPATRVPGIRTGIPAPTKVVQPGQAADDVVQAPPSRDVSPSSAPASPPISVSTGTGQLWPLESIQAMPLPQTYLTDAIKTGPPVLVAVLDTGIDGSHRDLDSKVVGEVNFIADTSTNDSYGHGTPVAGIIAADADVSSGIFGLAPESRLYNVKVADDLGRSWDTTVAEGIIWAVDNGARVINISIELGQSTPRLKEAVDYAWDHGAVIVAAAGNDGDSRPVYPAAYDDCLSVTAIRENGELAPLANYGDWVDMAAPGFDIYTILPGDTFGYKHGTSFATAYVSGLAALLFSLVADVDGDGNFNDEVVQSIYDGCRDTGLPGTGQGLIDVASSLARASALSRDN
jgi:subtilisin family serine protease